MKFLKQTLFVLALTFSLQSIHAQVTSADAMVNKIFAALKTKDEKAFIALYPNQQQMMRLMIKMTKGIMEEMKKSPEAMEQLTKESNGNIDSLIKAEFEKKASDKEMVKMQERYVKEFNKWIKLGEEKGIDWSTAQLVKSEIDTALVADEAMVKLFGSSEFRSMTGTLHLTSKDSTYQIKFDQVMFLPEEGSWLGVKIKGLGKEGEPLVTDDGETEIDETILESEVDAPVPPPPPVKTKSKTSSSKTKTKTPSTKSKTKTKPKS